MFLCRKVVRENNSMVTEDNLLGSEFFIYSMARAPTDLHVRYSQVYINRTWVRIIFQGYRLIVWKLHNFLWSNHFKRMIILSLSKAESLPYLHISNSKKLPRIFEKKNQHYLFMFMFLINIAVSDMSTAVVPRKHRRFEWHCNVDHFKRN